MTAEMGIPRDLRELVGVQLVETVGADEIRVSTRFDRHRQRRTAHDTEVLFGLVPESHSSQRTTLLVVPFTRQSFHRRAAPLINAMRWCSTGPAPSAGTRNGI